MLGCMKTLLRCLLLLALPILSVAQQSHLAIISGDSLKKGYNLKEDWRYHDGDDPFWAAPAFNDSSWAITANSFSAIGRKKQPFSGIAWFRKHIIIDTSVAGKALALTLSHDGASEIYLDGALLVRNGVIGGDSAECYDPNGFPFVFVAPAAGEHLLAIRYAEPDLAKDWGATGNSFDRLAVAAKLWYANDAVATTSEENIFSSISSISLASIFATLALLHLILYLYQRSVRSNGLFALFAFCLAVCFFIGFLASQPVDDFVTTVANWAMPYLVILCCISLSGFINALFGKRKWRFYLVIALGALVGILVPITDQFISHFIVVSLGFFVVIEVIVLVIIAVAQRTPGARIIAVGVLAFPAFVLSVIIAVAATGNGQFSGTSGMIIGAGLLCAILAIPISMSAYLAWSYSTVAKRLKAELIRVESLSEQTRLQEEERQRMLESRQEELEREVSMRTEQLRGEKQKSDALLLNILPGEVADELKEKGHAQARLHDDVSVIFTDFVDFTSHSERLSPAQIVEELDGCFKTFDSIIESHGLEKIKTIGDAYMAVAGLPVPHPDGAAATVRAALDIHEYIAQRRAEKPDSFDIRIGVHSGPVVAGIIGVKKFAYDVWGDTVNTAARMEQSGEPGKVNISTATYELIKDRFVCRYRGEVAAKGKGAMGMWFVESAV